MKNKTKFKIAVVGIGGVGGYVGGRLAARYADSAEIEIGLLARGANEKAIRENGLKLETTQGEFVANPKLINQTELNTADLLVLCTKDYDLTATVKSLKSSLGDATAVLPLLNGADTAARIAEILPARDIWQGCIYIVARLAQPGVVQETGNVCRIFFGSDRRVNEKMRRVEQIFNDAGIETILTADVSAKIWEKFIFISSGATATTVLDKTFHQILNSETDNKLFFALVEEVKSVAQAKKINVSEQTLELTFARIKNLPPTTTTSMHSDFAAGKKAEVEALVGFVVREAQKLNVPVPIYQQLYAELTTKRKDAVNQ